MNRRAVDDRVAADSTVLERVVRALGSDLDPAIAAATGTAAVIEGRCRELGVAAGAFAERLDADPAERRRLRELIVPSETWFFRYPAAFEHLREWASANPAGAIRRIASLGCATGAEAFSIAAALDGTGPVEIVAVDRCESALAMARSGRLGIGSVRGSIPEWAHGSWVVDDRSVVVHPRVRERVTFVASDLFDPSLPERLGRFEAIFCRNVAIYFNDESRRRLGAVIGSMLVPGGWLYLGHSESPASLGLEWRVRDVRAFAVRSPPVGATPAAADAPTESRAPAPRATPHRRPAAAALRRVPADASAPRPSPSAPPSPGLADIRALADEGRHAEALAAATAAHRRGARDAELLELLGTLSLLAGRTEDAVRHLRAALYLDPDREAAAIQLALLSEARDG